MFVNRERELAALEACYATDVEHPTGGDQHPGRYRSARLPACAVRLVDLSALVDSTARP